MSNERDTQTAEPDITLSDIANAHGFVLTKALRDMLFGAYRSGAAHARENAASLCETRADAGMESGSWDEGISAWDAAQILAAAIRENGHD